MFILIKDKYNKRDINRTYYVPTYVIMWIEKYFTWAIIVTWLYLKDVYQIETNLILIED